MKKILSSYYTSSQVQMFKGMEDKPQVGMNSHKMKAYYARELN
jgi:hypothetical protein